MPKANYHFCGSVLLMGMSCADLTCGDRECYRVGFLIVDVRFSAMTMLPCYRIASNVLTKS
jgi:hypothetical protein